MTVRKNRIRRIAFGVAALGLLIPVTVSPNQGIEGNEACANGSCCREMLSMCLNGDGTSTSHYYNSSSGVCAPVRE